MTETYSHLLVGLDLSDEAAQVLRRAQLLAQNLQAKISVAHVIEPLTFAYGGDVPLDIVETQKIIEDQAHTRLTALISESGVNVSQRWVTLGQTASEIHRLAEENHVDLVVVGSHGRHGLALLFGSTANGVLHGAKCDVLAVRV